MHETSEPGPSGVEGPADHPIDPALAGLTEPETPSISTENTRLQDGVNRCPKCGATEIELRPERAKLICLFCRHEWAEAQIEPDLGGDGDLKELRGTIIASGAADIDPEIAGVLTMKCSGCGSEVVVNTAEAMSARCHWCRHVLTVNDQIANGAVPDAVLPFSITREQAVGLILDFAGKRKMFAHSGFRKGFTTDNVMGVYLPYMIVDSNVSAEIYGHGEVGLRSYTRREGDRQELLHDADVFEIQRHVDFTVDDLTIESSAERANLNTFVNTNNVINSILPFDTKNAVRWNASYLTGFTSEKRDQDVSALVPVVEDQLLSIARSEVSSSIRKFNRGVRWESERLEVHGTRYVSMYLPVWLYSYYQQKRGHAMVHYIAVNGRTGETMGSVPVSQGRLMTAAIGTGVAVEGVVIALLQAAT